MDIVNGGLNFLFLLLSAGILGMSAYGLVHALRVPPAAFLAAGKLKKNIWLIILGLATLFSLAGAWSFLTAFLVVGGMQFIGLGAVSIFSIAAVIAATVYIVDVKPAVKGMGRGGGPYGGW
ncbi:hypothetical protein GCM10010149_68180 [Nonomuraea roseoviolacea subsp. roseoviolacea]|uniref:DUF2516 family protein n=1 Tax=Nonomuraea roseoviolacea subsp. carminata TaxID=160689 RepID=A0ABT1K009_9ACTN|nr:DUF2516 family protein [Nonomuraea roseoviolacea]MCP2346369.1 hypothetical protein [Nonomuraea roseoviolacea subsp. carminata]